ncbi:hypothetical protein CTI14_09310 [Methylobacterium radiotolerans]|nr:hypothetical protein CTI14_09310 [Methylobacterium radiotolerans]
MIAATPLAAWVFEPTEDDRVGDQPEIGLGFASAGRKPQEISGIAFRMIQFRQRGQVDKDEGHLEWSPALLRIEGEWASVRILVADPVLTGSLQVHGLIGQLEGA